jgi:hypothetical protein
MTGQEKGTCLIEVTTLAGLTVYKKQVICQTHSGHEE